MENPIKLNVKIRDVGKLATHRLRKNKMVPAIVYGSISNHPIALEEKLLNKYIHKKFEHNIFHLQCEESSEVHNTPVLIKAVDRDPVTQKLLHLDFYAPDMRKEICVTVGLKFVGKSIGEVEGGIFELMQRDIELSCLPGQIPKHIEVNISPLKIGDIYHISDLKLPIGTKAISSVDLSICAIKKPKRVAAQETPEANKSKDGSQKSEVGKDSKDSDKNTPKK